MNKKTLMTLAALAMAVISFAAPAARADLTKTVDCAAAQVARVKVRGSGTVWANFGTNSWWEICKVGASETYKGVTPAACEGMLSLLTAAQLSGRTVSLTVAVEPALPDANACVAGAQIYQIQVLD